MYVPNASASHLPATLSPSLRGLRAGPHTLRITLTYTRTRHIKHRTVHTTVTKTIKTTFTVLLTTDAAPARAAERLRSSARVKTRARPAPDGCGVVFAR